MEILLLPLILLFKLLLGVVAAGKWLVIVALTAAALYLWRRWNRDYRKPARQLAALRARPPKRVVLEVSLARDVKDSPTTMAKVLAQIGEDFVATDEERAQGEGTIHLTYEVEKDAFTRAGASSKEPITRARFYVSVDPTHVEAVTKAFETEYGEDLSITKVKDKLGELGREVLAHAARLERAPREAAAPTN